MKPVLGCALLMLSFLAVANPKGEIFRSSFERWVEFRLNQSMDLGNSDPREFSVGDLDGNGVLDIAVLDSAGQSVLIAPQDVNGLFELGSSLPTIADARELLIADLLGDPGLDVVVRGYFANAFAMYEATAQGFKNPVTISLPGHALHFAAGDYDANGENDFSILTGGSGQPIALHVFSEVFSNRRDYTTSFYTPRALLRCDLNADNYPELIVVSQDPAATLIAFQGSPSGFAPPLPFPALSDPSDYLQDAECLDWNSDGILDLLAVHSGESPFLSIRYGLGDMGFLAPQLATAPDYESLQIDSADLDRDGHSDIVVVELLGNRVTAVWPDGDSHTFRLDNPAERIKFVDVDADGIVDIIAQRESAIDIYIGM